MSAIRDPFPPTPAEFHLRVERTLDRLEENEMKKRNKFALAIAAALIAALLTATAVAATQYLRGIVYRDGHFEPDDRLVEVTPSPEPAVDAASGDPLADVPEGTRWVFVTEDGGREAYKPWELRDAGALNALLEGSVLPMPRLSEGDVAEGISAFTRPEAQPAEVVKLDGGTLYKYDSPGPAAENLEEISLCVRDADGQGVQYTARRVEAVDATDGYGVTGNYEALNLPGWDSALHITNDDGSHNLTLCRGLEDCAVEVELSAPKEIALDRLFALVPEFADADSAQALSGS